MKLKTRKRSDLQPRLSEPIVYMEVYGSNRVIYRVTAGSVIRQSVSEPFYGVTLEDLRTGERYSIADFSSDLEQTIRFANALVQQEIRPSSLYDAALAALSRKAGVICRPSCPPGGSFPDKLPQPVPAGCLQSGSTPYLREYPADTAGGHSRWESCGDRDSAVPGCLPLRRQSVCSANAVESPAHRIPPRLPLPH